jgi:hypothetical protein
VPATPPAPAPQPQGTQTITPPANTTPATAGTTIGLTCIDTDGGNEPKVKGTVQYLEGNVTILKVDECLGTSLREWYCDHGELQKAIVECSNGCANGACQ